MLEFDDIFFSYTPGVPVLRGATFEVHPGEAVALLGANGCGKSTIARMANALLLPNRGEVRVNGRVPTRESLSRIRKAVGLVFQDPDDTIVSSTVYDEVAFAPKNQGLSQYEIEDSVAYALEITGLTGFEERSTNALSGGEKQRLSLAAVLSGHPQYLVLDEATAMLDTAAREQLYKTVCKLKSEGVGVLFVTQNIEDIGVCERCVVLDGGVAAFNGTKDEFLRACYSPTPPEWVSAFDLPVAFKPRPIKKSSNYPVRENYRRTPTLEARGISYTYEAGEQPAISNLSARFEPGTITLLIGKGGAGKSTFLDVLAGLYQSLSGDVSLRQTGLSAQKPKPGEVALLMQHPQRQLFANTVIEDVSFGPRNMGVAKMRAKTIAVHSLDMCGLDSLKYSSRSPFSLSGGQARRTALAGVIALGSNVLLLDEPTSGLDGEGRRFLRDFLEEQRSQDKSIIISTHDFDTLGRIADSFLFLKNGEISSFCSASELTQADFELAGLALPPTFRGGAQR